MENVIFNFHQVQNNQVYRRITSDERILFLIRYISIRYIYPYVIYPFPRDMWPPDLTEGWVIEKSHKLQSHMSLQSRGHYEIT